MSLLIQESQGKRLGITNLHHYKVDFFYTVLNMQLQEFNDRFDEVNSELLVCMASLNLIDSFANLTKSIGDFARVLVETRKHLSHPLVYRLLKLCLILIVAAATVERCFSAMKILKMTSRHNSIGDEFLSDCLVCFIEKQVFETITNETVIKRFQNMSERTLHF
ncbi:hypothetical protein EUTSA_v10011986mg [Eutrema salsugineum]|uniref:HAT C-terminal dimerisation domain-containing protein n=1 Tax=Eutrema salsugineum TaxID=72664 RepID=V4KT97_EUTSA|nr:hypothetical protein EUTSA_v10011986mg [Eutrema salsugineum]